MGKTLIKNAVIFQEALGFIKSNLVIEDGKIADIIQPGQDSPACDEELDYNGLTIIPGLIDIHLHGALGNVVNTAKYDNFNEFSKYLAGKGVTSFLPSTTTKAHDTIADAAGEIKNAMEKGVEGAEILGMHLEGPFFSEKYRGAQNLEYLRKPDYHEVLEINELSGNNVRLVSVAAELDENFEFIKYLAQNTNIQLAQGHTAADYETACLAGQFGANHGTHMFNAMIPIDKRAPGILSAILDKEFTAELICDGVHVHPAIIRIVIKTLGPDKVAVITDSSQAAGFPRGKQTINGVEYIVEDCVKLPNGTIAGSVVGMIDCFRNLISWGISKADAATMCSTTPSKIIKVDDRKGSIRIGKDADFTVLDSDNNLICTISKGKVVYKA
jgi:N-acetylglucosamine-6-phosphate deacetylase